MNFESEKTSVFEVNNINFTYVNKAIGIKDLSLKMNTGEAISILGANGSGKSTLLKILDALYFPQKGEVKFFGKLLTEEILRDQEFSKEFRKRVGLVFQDPDVQLFLPTVKDEIAFAPLQMGLSKEEVKAKVDEAVKNLGIERLVDRAPYHLSEGEKKKVSLASILTLDPDIWLLDEPTASLDPKTQSWVIDFLLSLKEQKKTIIIATHDLEIAYVVAQKCFVLGQNHTLLKEADIDEILADKKLLLEANLIHAHRHIHDGIVHGHEHRHF